MLYVGQPAHPEYRRATCPPPERGQHALCVVRCPAVRFASGMATAQWGCAACVFGVGGNRVSAGAPLRTPNSSRATRRASYQQHVRGYYPSGMDVLR